MNGTTATCQEVERSGDDEVQAGCDLELSLVIVEEDADKDLEGALSPVRCQTRKVLQNYNNLILGRKQEKCEHKQVAREDAIEPIHVDLLLIICAEPLNGYRYHGNARQIVECLDTLLKPALLGHLLVHYMELFSQAQPLKSLLLGELLLEVTLGAALAASG